MTPGTLLRAALLLSPEDRSDLAAILLESIKSPPKAATKAKQEGNVLALLGERPSSPMDIMSTTGLSRMQVAAVLRRLQRAGRVYNRNAVWNVGSEPAEPRIYVLAEL